MSVFRNRPNPIADSSGSGGPSRSGTYSDAYVIPMGSPLQNLADEGSYFVAQNATVATGLAGHAAPVVADTDTKALIHLYNGGQKNVILDYVFLEVTAAGTAGTIHYTVVYVDNLKSTARSSGGTAITPTNVRSDFPIVTGTTVYFGAVVTLTGMTKVGHQIVREVIPVVQDTVLMKFGGVNAGPRAGLTTAGTATAHVVQHFNPVVIAPGGNLNIAQIRPSQTAAASYQISMGWIER